MFCLCCHSFAKKHCTRVAVESKGWIVSIARKNYKHNFSARLFGSKALTIIFLKAQQVATFKLPKKHIFTQYKIIAGYGKQTLVIALDTELKLYSLNGTELSTFQDHMKTITSIWVVWSVITTTCSHAVS